MDQNPGRTAFVLSGGASLGAIQVGMLQALYERRVRPELIVAASAAERIYILSTGQACELEAPPRGAIAMVVHAINLLVHRRLLDDIARFRDEAELIVLSPPCPVDVQPMDFGQAESLIERALEESRRILDERREAPVVSLPRPRPATSVAGPPRAA